MSSNLSTISSSNLRRALTKQKQENGKIREQQEKSMINKIPEELVSAVSFVGWIEEKLRIKIASTC